MSKFAQKVRSFEVEDDGQVETFYMKKPRGRDMLKRLDMDESRKGKATEDMLRSTLCDEQGAKLTPEAFEIIMSMESSAFLKLTTKIGELIAPPATPKPGEEGEEKND